MTERWVAWVFIFFVFSCSSEKEGNKPVKDDLGRAINWNGNSEKVISLAPSVTEVLYFLGLENKIVAVSESCDYPEEASQKTKIKSYPYTDIEKLVKIQPDLVLTYEGLMPENDIEKLKSLEIPVYSVSFKTVEEVFSGMKRIGELLDAPESSYRKVDSLENVYQKEAEKLPRTSAVCLISTQPMYAYGKATIVSENLENLGAENVVGGQFEESYPVITEEFLLNKNPDFLFFSGFENKIEAFFTVHPLLKELDAYQNGNIFQINADNASRPGPRVLANLKELKKALEEAQ